MESEISAALRTVSDDELLRRLTELVSQTRRVEADLVAQIGEVDERRLYARQACPSMFAYCTERLHLSEAEAYRRITVARAARRHPAVLSTLREGGLHLSGLARLVPLLTAENCEALLERATHLTTRQVEQLVAELSPRADVPTVMRKVPQRGEGPRLGAARERSDALAAELVPRRVEAERAAVLPALPVAASASVSTSTPEPTREQEPTPTPTPRGSRAPDIEPLSPARYRVQFTASVELRDKLERLTALMRSEVPDGDLAAVIERAVTEKLMRLEARRLAKTAAPRKTLRTTNTSQASRHIPAAVRRAVVERDGCRCRFVDEQGKRCSERHRLEFHHRHPYAMGGEHGPGNVSLLCAAHNRLMAEHDYGRTAILRSPPSAEVHRHAPGTTRSFRVR